MTLPHDANDIPSLDDRRRAPRPGGDRRRGAWREFRHSYPGFVGTMALAFVVMLAVDATLLYKRWLYEREEARLRASMSAVEREKTDAILAADEDRLRLTVELVRRQALGDRALNLAVSVDSGRMTLGREGARLRDMRVEVGPERRVGVPPDTVHVAAPRGTRTVERVLGPDDPWEVPAWVWADRGLPAPAERTVRGALGPHAIVLSGGTVIYAPPTRGPLNDPGYLLPGAVRAPAADLAAIAPNLTPGMTVYFY